MKGFGGVGDYGTRPGRGLFGDWAKEDQDRALHPGLW